MYYSAVISSKKMGSGEGETRKDHAPTIDNCSQLIATGKQMSFLQLY